MLIIEFNNKIEQIKYYNFYLITWHQINFWIIDFYLYLILIDNIIIKIYVIFVEVEYFIN